MENDSTSYPLGYLGGDIMFHGSQLARQEECDKIDTANLAVEYYSPAQNKSINDKKNVTEEENNHLAEKITEADIDRLWNSDFTSMCAEESAVGTLCEIGCLFGWKYMTNKFKHLIYPYLNYDEKNDIYYWKSTDEALEAANVLSEQILEQNNRINYAYNTDIRTNHLNEKDWRRSTSINQLLYGMILYLTEDGKLHESFDEILNELKATYGEKS